MKYTVDNPKYVGTHSLPEEVNFTGVVKDQQGRLIIHYENGRIHRVDGPAIQYANGRSLYTICEGWWYNGKWYGANNHFTVKSWKEKCKELDSERDTQTNYTIYNPKLVDHCGDPGEDNFTGFVKDLEGVVINYKNGEIHGIYGPAVEYLYGYKGWSNNEDFWKYLKNKRKNLNSEGEIKMKNLCEELRETSSAVIKARSDKMVDERYEKIVSQLRSKAAEGHVSFTYEREASDIEIKVCHKLRQQNLEVKEIYEGNGFDNPATCKVTISWG